MINEVFTSPQFSSKQVEDFKSLVEDAAIEAIVITKGKPDFQNELYKVFKLELSKTLVDNKQTGLYN